MTYEPPEPSKSDTRFTAEMLVEYVAAQRGVPIAELGVAPVVVVTWFPRVVRSLADSVGAQPAPHWIYGERNSLYTGRVGERAVSFVHMPIGAPGTVAIMEDLIACGGRTFWGLGMAGSLQTHATIGTCLIPTCAIREEGTSAHYLGPEVEVRASAELVAMAEQACRQEGLDYFTGSLWTTDAPYRETVTKIQSYSREGVLGVDMETSAMFALGRVRGVEVCNLLVVSDELLEEWRPAFGTDLLREAMAGAERAILRCAAAS